MSTKTYIRLWLAALSLVVACAGLYSIRDMLPDITVKAGVVLLALLAGYLLYLGHKFYVRFKLHHLELQAKEQELSAAEQNKRIEAERWQVERAALLLNQQIQAGRIYPDGKGYMPMVVSITEAGHQYIQLPHPVHQGRLSGGQSQQPQEQLPERAASLAGLPTSIRYEQIADQIPHGHGLLGVSATSVETAAFTDFMTMLISGGSNSGKSNTVGLKISEAIAAHQGIQLIVVDWHAVKPDSLYNKIRCYEEHFMLPVCISEEETMAALDWFLDEFNRRVDAGRGDQVVLLVIDEIPGMLRRGSKELVKKLKDIAETCGEESRGFGMYGWFIAQRMIGLAWLRNVVHTVIAHKAGRLSESIEACNGHKDIARGMELWPKGRVIVYGQNFEGVKVLQMPTFAMPTVDADQGSGAVYVEEEDDEMEELRYLPSSAKGNLPSSAREDFGRRREENQEASGRSFTDNDLLNPLTLKKFLNEAGKMRQEGKSIDAILKAYDLPAGGRNNQNLKALLDGQDQGQAANE